MDCNKLRCLYTFNKITEDEKKILIAYLDIICYTCDVTFTCHNRGFKDSLKKSSQKWHLDEVLEEDDDVLSNVKSEDEQDEYEDEQEENLTEDLTTK